jgi:NDP-sugar pyrophosphorylase family protein/mannose-6-phosphate isomerase-like protein (cupin superfamily)
MIIEMESLITLSSNESSQYINNKKKVIKPWGKEIWLALNDKYCYKRIEINAGFKTSYQYHNFKLETNYIIKGRAEVWLENDNNIVEKFLMNEGDFFTVVPPRKHRVIAITDVILQEVSTPEVDDVIRIDDEFNRLNGKIEEEHQIPIVCILAAGIGSRLGDLSKNCHKTLLPIKSKAILSHIIDSFDNNTEIVIATGYLEEQIKEYVSFYHHERIIKFINVNPYQGSNSGPAYSLQCCRNELQKPFYFCVADFYTESHLENKVFTKTNWIGLYDTELSELYSTVRITNNIVDKIINKSKDGFQKAFTGVFYMYDYKLFWEEFDVNVTDTFEIIDIFKNITKFDFKVKNIDWNDTGTLDLYKKIRDNYDGKNLYLHNIKNEFKYRKNNDFIKKIDTIDKIDKLFKRGVYLGDFIPKLITSGKYFYSYEYFQGKTLYQYNDKTIYISFLKWFEMNFCNNIQSISKEHFTNYSVKFYKDKTLQRIQLLKTEEFLQLDKITTINDTIVTPLDTYIKSIDWNSLIDTCIPTELFHGDLQFDNIIYNGVDFKLIDWREDFGGNTTCGDLYYDLAKLYGGMMLNYYHMKNPDNYSFAIINNTIKIAHYIDPVLNDIRINEYNFFLERNHFDIKKIKLLVALIFINMAPLHINNFDKFLFSKSKLLFSEILL